MFTNNVKYELFCYKLRTNCKNGSLLGMFRIVKNNYNFRCGDN